MSKCLWPLHIPGGVTDPRNRFAICRSVLGHVNVISLESGQIVWISGLNMIPMLADANQAYCLASATTSVVALSLDAINFGETLWTSCVPLPQLGSADVNINDSPLEWDVADLGDSLAIMWTQRFRYAGGAMPRNDVPKKETLKGVCNIDKGNGALTMIENFPPKPTSPREHLVSDDPEVMGLWRAEGREYRVALRRNNVSVQTVLTAVKIADSHIIWESVIDRHPLQAFPNPLRQ